MTARRILVVDDTPTNVRLLVDLLQAAGYETAAAKSGEEGLEMVAQFLPDLVLLDVMMPGLNGYDVCARLRSQPSTALLPIVLVTALDGKDDKVRGLEAGADDFLTKPIDRHELLARVRSLLRIRALYQEVEAQRLAQLQRFFSPPVAAMIASGELDPMKSHRSEITVVHVDLRGFTAFSESADPEDVLGVLRAYHVAMGALIVRHEGTVEHFAGDGIMIFFNDPLPVDNPALQAVRMALEMQETFAGLAEAWRKLGFELGLGIGIAQGHATMGLVGFEGRFDYGAVGAVCILAARLCAEAKAGQTLVHQRVAGKLDGLLRGEPVGPLELKGFPRPVPALLVDALT
jgi:adenylate cyclase